MTACSSTPSVDESTDTQEGLPESAQIDLIHLAVIVDKSRGFITVHFDYDESTLTEEAKQRLSQNMEWIRKHDNASLQLEGHCDKRGSLEYNLVLGERRAQTIKSYLIGLGASSQS